MGNRDLKIKDGVNCGDMEATDFLKNKWQFSFQNGQLYTKTKFSVDTAQWLAYW